MVPCACSALQNVVSFFFGGGWASIQMFLISGGVLISFQSTEFIFSG